MTGHAVARGMLVVRVRARMTLPYVVMSGMQLKAARPRCDLLTVEA
jgi:hypothetical protein